MVVDGQKEVSKIHKLIIIEGAYLCEHYASFGNKFETCQAASETSYSSLGS